MKQEEKFKEAKMLYKTANADQRYVLESLFPELAESEDEKMVKFIKKQLFNIKKTITENYELDVKLTKAIEWLERQGEQKPAWSEEDEKMCKETIDWFERKCFPYALEEENPARESIKWLKSLKQRIGGEE